MASSASSFLSAVFHLDCFIHEVIRWGFRAHGQLHPPDAASCRVSHKHKAQACEWVSVCSCSCVWVIKWVPQQKGGWKLGRRRHQSLGKSDPLFQHSRPWGLETKETRSAMWLWTPCMPPPVWLHSAFHPFNFIRLHHHSEHLEQTKLNFRVMLWFACFFLLLFFVVVFSESLGASFFFILGGSFVWCGYYFCFHCYSCRSIFVYTHTVGASHPFGGEGGKQAP